MNRGTFSTELMWHDSRGGEVEASVRVLYSYTRGYPQTWEEPGEPDEVEIISITPADPTIQIPEHFYTSAELLQECFEDWQADADEMREWLAQSRRDDALMDALEARK